jgi:2-succinyl-5-enolpyruvyl-6-hydroxy-3-cyclohexene-1-carboxylate synthase
MEAHYSGLPLVLLTADRPRSYRGSGAPQTAEQVGIFGIYVTDSLDLEGEEYLGQAFAAFCLVPELKQPFHVNVCFDEPLLASSAPANVDLSFQRTLGRSQIPSLNPATEFFKSSKCPVAVVSLLHPKERKAVADLLLKWQIPAYFEGISGLRDDPSLEHLRIHVVDHMMNHAFQSDYPVDGVVRIGGVPTLRLWRDLESKLKNLQVLSLSSLAFRGLSRDSHFIFGDLVELSQNMGNLFRLESSQIDPFIQLDHQAALRLNGWLEAESEPGMIHALSRMISGQSWSFKIPARIYLGNSLPIREWDLAAKLDSIGHDVWASRGLNGIDGQVSAFLGYARSDALNWAIVGDLTALYDLQAPWILPQLGQTQVNWVVVNNGGGKIFSKMFPQTEFQNNHQLKFSSVAELWGLEYLKWDQIPSQIPEQSSKSRLIELTPDEAATGRFWEHYLKC